MVTHFKGLFFLTLLVLISKSGDVRVMESGFYELLLSVFHVSLQLDLITDLLGTPSLEAMRTACEGAKAHILRGPHKQVNERAGLETGNHLDRTSLPTE